LELGHHIYVYVGAEMFQFQTEEPILKYVSSMGRDNIPHPYAESETYIYFLENHQYIEIKNIPEDIYQENPVDLLFEDQPLQTYKGKTLKHRVPMQVLEN
jgi:hypothetical protein